MKKTFKLGTKVIVSSRKCTNFGATGRVVGIKKDHYAPVQRLYVKLDGQNEPEVFSAQSLKTLGDIG